MGQILVRRIDNDLKARLKSRAQRHGVSMEEEVRTIIQNAVLVDDEISTGLGTQITGLFRDIEGWDGDLPQLPFEEVKSVKFDE